MQLSLAKLMTLLLYTILPLGIILLSISLILGGFGGEIIARGGEVPPPNTPATPKGPGSPTSTSSYSRAGSAAYTDADSDFCEITRAPSFRYISLSSKRCSLIFWALLMSSFERTSIRHEPLLQPPDTHKRIP